MGMNNIILKIVICVFAVGIMGAIAQDPVAQLQSAELAATQDVALALTLSESVGRMVGMAIEPVFGLALLGMWDYLHGVDHWTASPWLFGPLMTLLLLDLCKDAAATVLGPLMKPFDVLFLVVEFINGHLAAFVAAIYILQSTQLPTLSLAEHLSVMLVPSAAAADSGLLAGATALVVGLLVVAVFLAVWLLSLSFRLMIFLSPFNQLDLLLKSAQRIIQGVLLLCCLVFPPFGMIIAIAYAALAFWMMRWSLRWSSFGLRMVADFLFRRGNGPAELPALCFSGSGMELPLRTRGTLQLRDGVLCFVVSRLVGADVLPLDMQALSIRRGFFSPELGTSEGKVMVVFSPEYLGVEEELGEKIGGLEVVESELISGLRGAWKQLKTQGIF